MTALAENKAVSKSKNARRNGSWHTRYIAPMLGVLTLAAVVPLIYTVFLSVTYSNTDSLVEREFVGGEQYGRIFADPSFWNALSVQIAFVLGALLFEIVLGFFLALALNRPTKFASFVRSVLLAPAVLPTVVVALLASYLLQSKVGAISFLIESLGMSSAWADRPLSALMVLIFVDVWQFTPLVAVLLLAGLQGIPGDVIEASLIDGAGPVRRTVSITIPLLVGTLVTVGLLRLIDAIQVFPTIYVLTAGGPGEATNALNFWGFSVFFQQRDTAYGATIAVVLTAGTILLATLVSRLMNRQRKDA